MLKLATMTRNAVVGVGLLFSLLLLAACKEQPPWAQLGSLFTPEPPPAGKALVYIYWSADSPGTGNRVWVTPVGQFSEELRKGGYTSVAVQPGTTSVSASYIWQAFSVWGSGYLEYGDVSLSLQAGEVSYLKIEQVTSLGITRFDFRDVEPAVGASEIRRCRRMESLR